MRVVVFREGPYWLAQGLEHDVFAQGSDLKDVLRRLAVCVEAIGDSLPALPEAPKYFQDLWPLRAGDLEPVAGGLGASIKLGVVA